VETTSALHVRFHDRPFILRDSFGNFSADSEDVSMSTGDSVFNVWSVYPEGALKFRREVLSTDDRVEVTFWSRQRQGVADTIQYGLLLSGDMVEGATYKAVCGRQRAPQYKDGIFCEDAARQLSSSGVRYLWFDTELGGVWIDLDPRGVWAIDYSPRYCAWTIVKEGDDFIVKMTRGNSKWGHTLQGKFVVGSGDYCYPEIHPKDRDIYSTPLECSLTIDFGPGEVSPDASLKAVRCGTEEYSAERGYGWSSSEGLIEVVDESTEDPVRQDCVSADPNKKRTFIIDTIPGWYMVHLVFDVYTVLTTEGDFMLTLGSPSPDSVDIDGKTLSTFDEISEDHSTVRTYSVHTDDSLEISLGGTPWNLAAIMLQPLLYDTEDYTFKRSWWTVDESEFPPAFPDVADVSKVPTFYEDGRSPRDGGSAVWAWNCVATNWTVYNDGDREQFDTLEQAEVRAKEIYELGFNAVNISGEHFRYNLQDRYETTAQHTRLFVEACRKYGIKTIEHHEFTIPQVDGYRKLEHDFEWLQRDIVTGAYDRWFCINNPEFRQKYLDYLIDYQKKTGVDGYMLDEIAFCGIRSCGCKYCREAFKEATGETMPSPAPAEMVGDMKNALWRRWLSWRTQAVGDANKFFRDGLRKVREDLVFWTYSSVFTHPAVLYGGICMHENMKGADTPGMETMARHVYANWRPLIAEMRVRGGLAEHHSAPSWNLMYSFSEDSCYFAWAMGRMSKQSLWLLRAPSEKAARYLRWPEQMKDQHSKIYADIALIMSLQTRNSDVEYTYWYSEFFGWLESLIDLNLQFQVLLDKGIDIETLREFRCVILPRTACLSDNQMKALVQYMEEGGSVISTAETGLNDEHGVPQENSLLWDKAGIEFVEAAGGLEISGYEDLLAEKSLEAISSPHATTRIKSKPENEVLALLGSEGDRSPFIVSSSIGKGKMIYIAGTLGRLNFQYPAYGDAKLHYYRDENALALIKTLLTDVAGAGERIAFDDLPPGVVAFAYEQEIGGQREILIHLLNGMGAAQNNAQPADAANIPYPELKGELEFRTKENFTYAVAVSPDWEGKRPLQIEHREGNTYITLAADLLEKYTLLRLR